MVVWVIPSEFRLGVAVVSGAGLGFRDRLGFRQSWWWAVMYCVLGCGCGMGVVSFGEVFGFGVVLG